MSVTFDGINKVIEVANTVTSLDVKEDIYSPWKEWVKDSDNAKYFRALTAIGGDPITGTLSVGSTFFLENGWRIKPWDGNYLLTIAGNIYTREEGENPIIPTGGVAVSLTRSNLVDLLTVSGGSGGNGNISNTDIQNIVDGVWEKDTTPSTGANTYGELVKDTNTNATDALKKGEFLALK